MIHGSMTHDFTGRKRKPRKAKGAVLKKYTPPPSARNRATPNFRRDAGVEYNSVDSDVINTAAPEKKKYTGTLVKGIATMHKSNMVPIFEDQKEQAVEIAQMRR